MNAVDDLILQNLFFFDPLAFGLWAQECEEDVAR